MEMISCSKCGDEMPELRKIKFGYDFCIKCSDQYNMIGRKKAITVQKGEGDHTWNETIIMSEKEFMEYEKQEELVLNLIEKRKINKAELLSFDNKENANSNKMFINPKED
jgi:glycyl-tRNA synthetase alpha subunit